MLYLLAFLAFCLIFSKLVCGRWIPLSYGDSSSNSASASLNAYRRD